MKKRSIIKYIGVFVMIGALLIPSITADITKRDIVKQSISISEICEESGIPSQPGNYISVPINGQITPQRRTDGDAIFEFNTSAFFSNDSGFAGCLESINENLFAYPQFWINAPVFNCSAGPSPIYASKIYVDFFLSDSRTIRQKAYLEMPTLDFKRPGEAWRNGWMLGGAIVLENGRINRQWVGTYGLTLFQQSDVTIMYRENLFYFKEVYRDAGFIYFQYDHNISEMGLWHIDVPPYSNSAPMIPREFVPLCQTQGITLNTLKGMI